MANIIVVSFNEETKAIEALHKMKELDSYGDITLYSHMIIRKKANNSYEILDDNTEGDGWRTVTGMALGGLIGAIAGPIGFVLGLASGTAAGAVLDASHYDLEDEFIDKVNNKMKVGDITIISEVGEDSPLFLDNYLKPFNVEIIRTDADVEFDNFVDEQIEEVEDEIDDLRDKLKNATEAEKTKIKARITELKVNRKAKIAELEAKRKSSIERIKDKTKLRIDKLESRLNHYKDTVTSTYTTAKKNRLKKRIKREEDKLNQLHNALAEELVD